jgi:Secretion system C-terminal sorting domain
MKTYKYLIFFFFIGLFPYMTARTQPIDWDSVRAAYVVKYKPQQMPAWLFPIVFEEGGGQRDTIYLGYNEDALSNVGETWFGEILLPVDTSRFNVSICLDFSFDSIYKVLISPLQNSSQCGGGVFDFSFYKGLLPLKMYWDRMAFYSDSLPFADSVKPKGMGFFHCGNPDPNYQNCNFFYPYYMTDDPMGFYSFWDSCTFSPPVSLPYFGPAPCYAMDSIIFYGTLIGGGYRLEIVPYGSNITGLEMPVVHTDNHMRLYPNPGTGEQLVIRFTKPANAQVIIYNVTGQPVMVFRINNRQEYQKDISKLDAGLYMVTVKTEKESYTGKLMVE